MSKRFSTKMIAHRYPGSLRDPAGILTQYENRLIRIVHPESSDLYRELLDYEWFKHLMQSGEVVNSILVQPEELICIGDNEEPCGICIEHKKISFQSFPSEWPLEMLCTAAELTISLCITALSHGYGLKDATPFNVLFRGPFPVFVDFLSFEKRAEGDPTWLAHGQFVRSFLLPILMDARYGIACHSTFLVRRDGIEPEEAYRLLSPMSRLAPPFLGNVTLPVFLAARAERQSNRVYAPKILSNSAKATFILLSLFSRLNRTIQANSIRRYTSKTWTTYNDTCTYTATAYDMKTDIVVQFLQEKRPTKLLDVGCNTGHFSFLAAQHGAEVVATDLDPEVVGSLWKRANLEKANILPLVVNLAQPTPALGWRNRETPSFLERAEGYFDAVLMLAVVHHLLVTDQIPLDEIILQAFRLTTEWLVIEYVGLDDPQFKRLLRGRDAMYGWYGRDVFEMELCKQFEIIRKDKIADCDRWLYLARRRNAN